MRAMTALFDRHFEYEDHLNDAGCASAICILPVEGNGVFYVTSVKLHMLKIKGLFGVQAQEYSKLHLKNFIEVCAPFDIAHIT